MYIITSRYLSLYLTSTYVPIPSIFKSPISAYIDKTTAAGSGSVYEQKKSFIMSHLIVTKYIIIVSANEHFV